MENKSRILTEPASYKCASSCANLSYKYCSWLLTWYSSSLKRCHWENSVSISFITALKKKAKQSSHQWKKNKIYCVDNGSFHSFHAITFGKRKCIQWLSCVQHVHLVLLLLFMSPFNLGQRNSDNIKNINKQLKISKYFFKLFKMSPEWITLHSGGTA